MADFLWTFRNSKSCFRNYFPCPDSGNNWIRDPFNTEVSDAKNLSAFEEDSLVGISWDISLKLQFNKIDLTNFWLRLRSDYPALANRALKHLVPFCTTYLCEQAFSVLLYVKSKYRNKLNVEADLRIKLSNIKKWCSFQVNNTILLIVRIDCR